MQTKVYLQVPGDHGYNYVPYENFKWTGRWKVETIRVSNGGPPPGYEGDWEYFTDKTSLYVERQFGIFPWWKVWENYDSFKFQEEECFINDCEVL